MDSNIQFGPKREGTCKNKGCNNYVLYDGSWRDVVNGRECIACFGKRLAEKIIKKEKKEDKKDG